MISFGPSLENTKAQFFVRKTMPFFLFKASHSVGTQWKPKDVLSILIRAIGSPRLSNSFCHSSGPLFVWGRGPCQSKSGIMPSLPILCIPCAARHLYTQKRPTGWSFKWKMAGCDLTTTAASQSLQKNMPQMHL